MRERSMGELIEEPAEPLPPMALEAVAPAMSSPAMHRGPGDASELSDVSIEWGPVPDLPMATATRRLELEVALVVGAGTAAWVTTADVRVAILVTVLALGVISLQRIDRHLPFSFGQGFIGYRADLGWPHGVQEDDDVHWNWRPAPAARASRDRNP